MASTRREHWFKLRACVIPFNWCIVVIFSVGRSKPTQKFTSSETIVVQLLSNDIQWGLECCIFPEAHKAGPVLTTIPKHAWSDRGFIACTRPAAGSSGLTSKDRRGFATPKMRCLMRCWCVALVALGLPPTCHHLWSKSQRIPRTKPNLSASFSGSKLIKILGVYT